MIDDLAHEELLSVLSYNRITGDFIWIKKRANCVNVGAIAGSINSRGYIEISIKGRKIKAHRLAWFYVHGSWPANQIDHIDGNKTNNSISNLREATISENQKNSRNPKTNTTGYKGVTYKKSISRYVAQISNNNKKIHIGCFDTPEKAHAAYCEEAKKLHGKFARFE